MEGADGRRRGRTPAMRQRTVTPYGQARTPAAPRPVPLGAAAGAPAVWAITNARDRPGDGRRRSRRARSSSAATEDRGGRRERAGAGRVRKSIDAKGGHVYPGFINASTTVGIGEPGVRGFDDVSEMLDCNQHCGRASRITPRATPIPVARANGVTTSASRRPAGSFGGEVAVMNLDGWTWEEATRQARRRHRLQLPALAGGGGRGGGGGRWTRRR